MTVVAAVSVAAALGVSAWLWTGVYTRHARLDGVVVSASGGDWHADLFATASNRAALRVGQSVGLRHAVPPGGRAGVPATANGAIVSIAGTPVSASERVGLPSLLAARAAAEPLYRVTARFDRPPVAPSIGGAVVAHVPTEQHRLIEWLFSPRLRAAASA